MVDLGLVMDRTLISWNVPNVITIWLMLAIGFLLVAVAGNYATSYLSRQKDGNGTATGGW